MHSSVNEQTGMLGEKHELAEMETDSPDVQLGVVTFLGSPDNVADGRRQIDKPDVVKQRYSAIV